MAEKEYTFFSNVHKSYTRIDYFFLPRIMLQSVISSSIGNIVISDHAAVSIQYNLKNPVNQTRHWKFNPSILTDHKFMSYFREEFQYFLSVNSASTNDPSLLWETSKAFSRGIIISYMPTKRRKQDEQRKILESKLKLAEKEYVKNSSVQKLKDISALRCSLNLLLTKDAEGKIRLARQKMYEHGDKVGRYLSYLTKKKADSQIISSVIDSLGKQAFDTKTINNTFKTFYENFYKSGLQTDNIEKIDTFFSSLNLPSLSADQKTSLQAPISKKEVLDAIKGLQSGKAPGPDGFSSEFYKEFHDLLIDPLLNMFNDSSKKGILPQSLREAHISLILKKGKIPEDCASYRPISC